MRIWDLRFGLFAEFDNVSLDLDVFFNKNKKALQKKRFYIDRSIMKSMSIYTSFFLQP